MSVETPAGDTQLSADIVVIGGGLAGLSAALEAAEAGAQVIVLEMLSETGGSSAMSGGCFAFAGTDLQREHGVQDSDELLFQDLREVGQFENDEAIVRTYVRHQLSTYEWLKAHGVKFSPALEVSSGVSVPRIHNVDPADMMRALLARCRAVANVRLLTETRVQRLLRNADTGRVTAVLAERAGGALTVGAAKAVILATGGFCRNPELIHRFVPQYDDVIFIASDGNQGDGFKMGLQLGADFRDTAYIKGTYGKHPVDLSDHHSCLAVYKGGIAVNQEGKRFVDESISYKLLADACLRQSDCSTYQIFDQDIFESGDDRVRILDFGRRKELGLMFEADSLEKLARLIEIPADTLLATVAQYNAYVDAGHDPDFGRKHLCHNYGELRRIERAPFYAFPSTVVIFTTFCGLRIDSAMRVIDVFGAPIAGLLAAGEVVGGLHGGAHMTGSGLGKAAIFGRLAARTALGQPAA